MICCTWFSNSSVSSKRWYIVIPMLVMPSHQTSLKVAVERVKEYSELEREPPEFVDPRPPVSWPTTGHIECKDLVIRYSVGCRCRFHLARVNADELFLSPSCQMCFMVSRLRLTPERRYGNHASCRHLSIFYWVCRGYRSVSSEGPVQGRALLRCLSSDLWRQPRGRF